MSTTAQESGQTSISHPPGEAPAAEAAAAPTPAPPARSSEVEYLLFEEARADTWTQLSTVRASSPQAAIESLGEAKLKAAQGRFMAVPTRYVTQKKPKVTTVTNIDWD